MKVVKKLSLPVLSLLFFMACKDNSQSKRNIQLISDSTVYNNSSTSDSLETEMREAIHIIQKILKPTKDKQKN
jgi:hypothetical protein